jgi:hypothetical protein
VPTDEQRFRQGLLETFQQMMMLWADLGYNEGHVFDFYFRKSEVNAFRQRSNY